MSTSELTAGRPAPAELAATACAAPSRRPARAAAAALASCGWCFGRRRNLALLAVLACVAGPHRRSRCRLLGRAAATATGPPFLGQITDNGLFLVFTALVVTLPLFLPLAVVGGRRARPSPARPTSARCATCWSCRSRRTRLLVVKYAGIVVVRRWRRRSTVAVVGVLVGLALFPHRRR